MIADGEPFLALDFSVFGLLVALDVELGTETCINGGCGSFSLPWLSPSGVTIWKSMEAVRLEGMIPLNMMMAETERERWDVKVQNVSDNNER